MPESNRAAVDRAMFDGQPVFRSRQSLRIALSIFDPIVSLSVDRTTGTMACTTAPADTPGQRGRDQIDDFTGRLFVKELPRAAS